MEADIHIVVKELRNQMIELADEPELKYFIEISNNLTRLLEWKQTVKTSPSRVSKSSIRTYLTQ